MRACISTAWTLAETMSAIVARRHLMNDAAYARATAVEQHDLHQNLARQILGKIKAFFGSSFETRVKTGTPVASRR